MPAGMMELQLARFVVIRHATTDVDVELGTLAAVFGLLRRLCAVQRLVITVGPFVQKAP
jgi:hypothetical protein